MKRKSQVEIMGLMLIVIIVALIMLFAIKSVVFHKKVAYKFDFEQKHYSSSIISAILHTSSGCRQTDVSDLIIDCALSGGYGGTIICDLDDGRRLYSCEYAKEVIDKILNSTIGTWVPSPYEFRVNFPNEDPFIYFIKGNISVSSGGKQIPFPLPLSGFSSEDIIEIRLCMGGCGLD